MAKTTAVKPLTRIVRIYHNDGTIVEAEVTPVMARAIKRMEWADEKKEQRYQELGTKAFTDIRLDPNKIADKKRSRGAEPKPGIFEGPRPKFTLHYGFSAIWAGPDSLWITEDLGKTWKCRFCFHAVKMPAYACCLGCDRTGRDKD